MLRVEALPRFLCVMGFLSETLCSLSLTAQAGDEVTVWCEFNPNVANYISWFKHTSDSVPLRLACRQFLKTSPPETCYFFTDSERIVMSVYGKNTSLTITAVNVSDTGLYYCSYSEETNFSTSTFLHVKDKNTNSFKEKETGSDSPAVFVMLTVVFGALSVIILGVLICLMKQRKNSPR